MIRDRGGSDPGVLAARGFQGERKARQLGAGLPELLAQAAKQDEADIPKRGRPPKAKGLEEPQEGLRRGRGRPKGKLAMSGRAIGRAGARTRQWGG